MNHQGQRIHRWMNFPCRVATNVPVDFVVTPQVQAVLARDGELSLELFSLSNVGGPGTVSYVLREDADLSVQPQLLVVTTTPPILITPPRITNCVWSGSGAFTLSGVGSASAGYRIFATTNLAPPASNWTATATGNFSGGVFNFTDVQTTNYPQRFYRVVTP
jgi:hypothetical protein